MTSQLMHSMKRPLLVLLLTALPAVADMSWVYQDQTLTVSNEVVSNTYFLSVSRNTNVPVLWYIRTQDWVVVVAYGMRDAIPPDGWKVSSYDGTYLSFSPTGGTAILSSTPITFRFSSTYRYPQAYTNSDRDAFYHHGYLGGCLTDAAGYQIGVGYTPVYTLGPRVPRIAGMGVESNTPSALLADPYPEPLALDVLAPGGWLTVTNFGLAPTGNPARITLPEAISTVYRFRFEP